MTPFDVCCRMCLIDWGYNWFVCDFSCIYSRVPWAGTQTSTGQPCPSPTNRFSCMSGVGSPRNTAIFMVLYPGTTLVSSETHLLLVFKEPWLPIARVFWLTEGIFRFEPFVPNEDEDYSSHEVTVIFLVSQFQYITMAICFSKSAPYRKTIFSNCKL